ncbi:hypothetical protein KHQ82_05385 [Mycoplasmatota bacterium]|nr:hypothetical protein KHQ82_05385 [Mycoplasmatota bacterium]
MQIIYVIAKNGRVHGVRIDENDINDWRISDQATLIEDEEAAVQLHRLLDSSAQFDKVSLLTIEI